MASTSSAFEVPELPANTQGSDESSEDDEELGPPVPKKKRGKNLNKEFDLWWQAEVKNWWFHARGDGKDEAWEQWYCKFNGGKSGRVGVKCEARIRIYFCNFTDAVRVMVCEKEHNHTAEKQIGLSDPLKTMIGEYLAHGMTAKKIHIKLTSQNFDPMPTLKQVQVYIDNQRAATSKPFTDAQMQDVESIESFYVLWTTPKLLQRQLQSDQLQVDATYKTNWHEYPVIIVGHSNVNHQFQPTMLAVGVSEDQFAYGAEIVTKPTIPLKVHKAAHQLQQQCSGAQQPKRYFIKISGGGAPTYAFSAWNENTKQSAHQTDLELYAAYRSFAVQGVEDFKHYKKDRFKVYVVRPASNGQYYVCTCPEGSKKAPCKHATMIMCAFAGLYDYPAEATANPMKTNRKVKENGGRRPHAKSQNRYAAGP